MLTPTQSEIAARLVRLADLACEYAEQERLGCTCDELLSTAVMALRDASVALARGEGGSAGATPAREEGEAIEHHRRNGDSRTG